MREKTYAQGEWIFREGEQGTEAFQILSGRVEITIHVSGQSDATLGHLVVGDIFGEMALLDEKPRSASARALEPTRLHLMNSEEFSALFLKNPKALAPFLSSFFERLRHTNDLLRRELERRQISPTQLHQFLEPTITGGKSPSLPPLPRLTLRPSRPDLIQAGVPESISVDRLPYRIGRRQAGEGADILSANDLALSDRYPYQISRNHCVIERLDSSIVVRDRGSTLGTIVNGKVLGTESEQISAPLNPGSNQLILGTEAGPFHFSLQVEPRS